MTLRTLLAALSLSILVACSTAPYTPTTAERAGMQARVAQFTSDFTKGRYGGVVDVVPPKVTANLAASFGLSPAAMRKQSIAEIRNVSRRVTLYSYKMDTSRAVFQQLPSGRSYALIPTQTVVGTPNGGKLQSDTTTLAFEEGGTWYLVRIGEDHQRKQLIRAYPEFNGLRVFPGTFKEIG